LADDQYGRRIAEEFQVVGTDLSLVERRVDFATPLSFIMVNKQNGSRTVINRTSPHPPVLLPPWALSGISPRVLLFDGHEIEASLMALETFPQAISILDAGSWREGTAALAGKVDYLVASEKFALQACALPHLDEEKDRQSCIRQLRQRYDHGVVVTLGEKGLIADDGPGYYALPVYPAVAVDTTAAGDVFHGAFAYGILRKMPFRETLRFASMTASLSVRKPGGRLSIPRLAEVQEGLAHVE
jgi:sugar/nucleoside kinase (ribokinase family)